MKLIKTLLFLLAITSFQALSAQKQVSRIEPPNWWAGMKNPQLQLMMYGKNIGDLLPAINYPGVTIERAIRVQNTNYLFVDLVIGKNTKPGKVTIEMKKSGKTVEAHIWELLERETGSAERQGFTQSDVMYLITPDRFANGDPGNDNAAGLKEKSDRSNKGGRHGGDIKGLVYHLDYIKDLGFNAIWVNPVLENNQEEYSYHGYSTSDFYKVDPRFGTNEDYRKMSQAAKAKGVKLIMDMIVNHCGSGHWWMNDLPADDWLNHPKEYVQTNHRKSVLQDPHVAQADVASLVDGWFVPTMPDLNQRNPLMAIYLTQNSIWWIEYAGLAGIRMDTYPYPDMHYMTEWTKRVMEEYPGFNVVGEEWSVNPAIVAYWQRGKVNPNSYTSELKSVMDFPLQSALNRAMNEPQSNWSGLLAIYEMLANDFQYADPDNLVVFPDNHDMSRIYTQLNEDFDLFKMAITFILTTRGVPQIYYGTEVLMTNPGTDDHGIIRSDFPGGWAGDKVNAVTGEGLTGRQKEAKAFFKKILHWRQTATAIHDGKLIHYAPENGIYVYFRFNKDQKVMVILNRNTTETSLKLDRFSQMLNGVSRGKELFSGKILDMKGELPLTPKSAMILELD